MADTEFEEFRINFDKLPKNNNVLVPFYSLVPDILVDEESPTSSKSDEGTDCGESAGPGPPSGPSSLGMCSMGPPSIGSMGPSSLSSMIPNVGSMDSIGPPYNDFGPVDPGPTEPHNQYGIQPLRNSGSFIWNNTNGIPGERRRRKLPEIPKNKKSTVATLYNIHQMSLADELGALTQIPNHHFTIRSCYLRDDSSSPDSERLPTDVDSGHSTAHSPTDAPRSMSPMSFGGVPASDYEMLEPTHRGLHKFIPRHSDEIEVEIGDPIYVQKESEDLWCEGVNLRTGRLGIFPSAYAVDQELSAWESDAGSDGRRERFQLGYLGSVETLAHKGTSVVCQAVKKVAAMGNVHPTSCILEISDQGLRMVDRSKKNKDQPCIDYFYSLKNVSFCAFHPRDHRYLGFITKHPTLQRFACHVFRGIDSTRPVAESVGRAFQRFYQKFIETAYPIEDIYIE